MKHNRTNWHKKNLLPGLTLMTLVLAGLLLIVGSGGGGGDGGDSGDGDDGDTVGILSEYEFRIGGPLTGDAGQSFIDIQLADSFSLSSQPDVQGTLSCDPVSQECELETVAVDSSIVIDDQTEPVFVDDITITVNETWVYDPPGFERPVAGSLLIDPLAEGESDILVEVADCDGGEVLVTVGEEPGTCYTWDDFEGLEDDPEATLQELQAALGWSAIEFTLEQAAYSLEVFPLMDEDLLPNPGTSYWEDCDEWSGEWPVDDYVDGYEYEPPVNPGSILFTWYDDLADGEIGPSDSFQLEFNHCWFDEDGDNGTLTIGVVDFVGYVEEVQNNTITRIGFETPAAGSGKIPGVAYGWGDELQNQPLVMKETVEEEGQIFIENTLLLSGRYHIVFAEPTL